MAELARAGPMRNPVNVSARKIFLSMAVNGQQDMNLDFTAQMLSHLNSYVQGNMQPARILSG
jgi:hypothetical protein